MSVIRYIAERFQIGGAVLLALEVFNDDETAQKPDLPARPEPRRTFAVSRGCPLYDISRSDFRSEVLCSWHSKSSMTTKLPRNRIFPRVQSLGGLSPFLGDVRYTIYRGAISDRRCCALGTRSLQ